MRMSMNSNSSHPSDSHEPKRLKTFASNVKFTGGNTLLHRLVLDHSDPNESGCGNYVNAVLISMSDNPGSVVNALNDDGYSALHLAVSKNNVTMVKRLLCRLVNIEVNARCGWGDDGKTALHLATELRHESIVRELMNRGASIAIESNEESPLCVAIGLQALDLVKILVRADVNKHTKYNTPLHEATYVGSLEIVEYLIDRGADIDARDGTGTTPLIDAAYEGYYDIMKLLIGKGADLHAADRIGFTSLHAAAAWNRLECVRLLLDQGARLHADVRGWTPLHYAADEGQVNVLKELLDRGADVNATNRDGKTPLDLAREKQRQSCIDVLENV